ncbi:MAG: DUF2461 domain-containing protein [Gammaproteobacteria bacterium]|nr:DUF2461 domain-containing protein [Gammaproteobacteria bacterium]
MNHFNADTFTFLQDLAENNSREWFADHKQQYEDDVRSPALAFIDAVGEQLPGFAPHFRADIRKMGGSLMRVHRDTRFGKDKTPYKTNIGIQFRHEVGKDVHAPGFYLHISSASCFVGVGTWHPPSDSLALIRQSIIERPQAWCDARDQAQFSRWFSLSGDSLKTAPRGYPKDHAMIEDLRRKDFIAISDIAPALIEQEDFAEIVCDYFRAGLPMMQFLCKAMRLPC